MYILGISAFYHDAAAALVRDGMIVAAAEEERFTRIKHDAGFPINAIRFCLQFAGIDLREVTTIVFYDKPLLKFERLLETFFTVAPKGWTSFLTSIPVWVHKKLFLKQVVHKELRQLKGYSKQNIRLLFTEHHLSHAASAFYPSPFSRSAIITVDGVGEWATTSIAIGEGANIQVLKEMQFPDSVGLLYSAFTYYLGFKVNSGEYKLMGVAPYGNRDAAATQRYVKRIKENLCHIYDDGSIKLNPYYFSYTYSLRMVRPERMRRLFGFPRRAPGSEIKQHHCDLALAVQLIVEEIMFRLADHAKELTGCENLCMAGGVALNSVANGKLHARKIFKNIFVQPAAGDSGGALGAALAGYHLLHGGQRTVSLPDQMKGAYLGPCFDGDSIKKSLAGLGAVYDVYPSYNEATAATAALLAKGQVVGWFQGRMEFGPRALGSRSILADPRSAEMQQKLNLKIKYREGFRPFAPAVLAEDASTFFQLDGASPYMLLVKPVVPDLVLPLPEDYQTLPLWDKLNCNKSLLPAITHVDLSARIQTVHKATNPLFHQLLTEFKKITGVPVLVNTSFNVRGEPIVCTPEDAYRCLMNTEMDALVMDRFIILSSRQPRPKPAGKPKKFMND